MDKPTMADPAWNDYVLSQFTENEVVVKDNQTFPKVNSLRRVTRALIGDIIGEHVRTVQAPSSLNDFCATVEAMVQIEVDGKVYTFAAVADANNNNTDPVYRQYPSAMAETRAVGRAFRKALALNNATYEEISKVANEDSPNRADSNDFKVFAKFCEKHDLYYKDVLSERGLSENVSRAQLREIQEELKNAGK